MLSFLNIAFLAGMVGVAIPIAIHLLNREKPRRVDFGWLRFLTLSHRMQARRFRLREILILIMRALLCALLALAFARPFLAGAERRSPLNELPAYVALVVDVSYSMGYGTWFRRAQQRVLDTVDALDADDHVALLEAGDGVRTLVEWTTDRERVHTAVRNELQPTYETTDLGMAFRAAEQRLRAAPGGRKVLYIFSDHQEVG